MREHVRPRPWREDRGSVTAEVAVVLPVIVLALVAVLTVAAVGVVHLSVIDGARAGARAAALGVPEDEVVAAARTVAGGSAAVDVAVAEGWARVTVRRGLPARAGLLGALGITATAVAAIE
ncbi:TadE family type IV pilus minor pilin [Sanguibacter sp. A247]|uniref:TadE family type IV pilus minor pilin n=1 Tax=unclassified Sanguibacter TaxID=2645534 RepID=UPI003FD78CF0